MNFLKKIQVLFKWKYGIANYHEFKCYPNGNMELQITMNSSVIQMEIWNCKLPCFLQQKYLISEDFYHYC